MLKFYYYKVCEVYKVTTSKCDQASDLLQQLKLASELESDLWDTVNWDGKWLVSFSAWKTQLVLFDTGAIDVKMDKSVLEEKVIFQDAGVDFLF